LLLVVATFLATTHGLPEVGGSDHGLFQAAASSALVGAGGEGGGVVAGALVLAAGGVSEPPQPTRTTKIMTADPAAAIAPAHVLKPPVTPAPCGRDKSDIESCRGAEIAKVALRSADRSTRAVQMRWTVVVGQHHLVHGHRATERKAVAVPVTHPERAGRWCVALRSTPTPTRSG
jgi:hypothetical protein